MKSKLLSLALIVCMLVSCVSFTVHAEGLTLLNSITDGDITTSASKWIYNYDKNTVTQETNGLGGKATDDTYAKIVAPETYTTGSRYGMLLMGTNADYYTKNYFVFNVSVYGNNSISYIMRSTQNLTVTLADGLSANRWNNITFVYDRVNYKLYPYINGVAQTAKNVATIYRDGQVRIVLNASGHYYMDDLAIYCSDTAPVITLPAAKAGETYTVSGNEILYSADTTVADFVADNPTAKVYTDSTLATEAESTAVLTEGNCAVVSGDFNAADESVYSYNYYTVAAAPVTSGAVTDTINWDYDLDTKTLTITGTGELPDWSTAKDAAGAYVDNHISYRPWINYNREMVKAVIGEGITSVGQYMFAQASSLADVELASTVEELDEYSFFHTGITELELNDGIKYIRQQAFTINNATAYKKLTKIVIPASVEYVHESAFTNQTDVTVYCYEESVAHKYVLANNMDFFLCDAEYALVYDKDTMTATVKNFCGTSEKAIVIFANATTGVLNSVDFQEVTLPGIGAELTITAVDFVQAAGSATEIMLWDSMSVCKPMCSSIGKTIPAENTTVEAE
ncbi:MAG: leucine-rich repeat protein [Clostridia bacterium]|nr:leucine-rich repeat protein [Clostridia bacterium]